MYININVHNIVRAVAAAGSFVSTLGPDNVFKPAGPGDLRSPCPALNTLANHGFLPRNGKNISLEQFMAPLTQIYRLSSDLATELVTGGVSCCGNTTTNTIDLSRLALHNAVEHDGSLAHADANGAKFAPTTPDPALLKDLFTNAPGGFGINDFAAARVRRESKLSTPLDSTHETFALGESALTFILMKNSTDIVAIDTLKQWYGQETFPDCFNIPVTEVTSDAVSSVSGQIATAMAAIVNSSSTSTSTSA